MTIFLVASAYVLLRLVTQDTLHQTILFCVVLHGRQRVEALAKNVTREYL